MGEAWNNLAALYAQTGYKAPALDAVRSAEKAGHTVEAGLKKRIDQLP